MIDASNGMASWTANVLPWLVAGVVVLFYFVSLWRHQSPNHVFFLSLLERLREATEGDNHEKPKTDPQ